MKKKLLLLVCALVLVLTFSLPLFSCDNTEKDNLPNNNGGEQNNDNNNNNPIGGDDPTKEDFFIKIYVNNNETAVLIKDEESQIYSALLTLNYGDMVKFVDSKNNQLVNYEKPTEFCGTVKIKGEYKFTVSLNDDGELISVVIPEIKPNPTPEHDCNHKCKTCGKCTDLNCTDKICANKCTGHVDPTPEHKCEHKCGTCGKCTDLNCTDKTCANKCAGHVAPNPNHDRTITVFYSNSERWSRVYAYVWSSKTNTPKKAWPGEILDSIGTSEYGEKQYSFTVDSNLYDRIIFNDGNGKQTRDLTLSLASSGYYGVDGIFTMNKENYGKVEYFTLKDEKNLSYTRSKTKKFSVYTPSNYSANKKYAVLYMFDSQNLYIGADGAEQSHDSYGSWAVDVAVNNLVANGKDGFIIVAIDNTDGYRDSELTMSQDFGTLTNLADNKDFYNGKLDMLGNFISETLMPWVNSHYSVYGTREKTGIAGSSSGGLASYYLGLRDNHLYGYIGAFSPANGLFTTKDWNNFYAKKDFKSIRPLIYAYCGEGDSNLEDMLLPATKEIKNLTKYGYTLNEINENYVKNGNHSENFWRIAFVEFASMFSDFCDK